jgi:hypothetical protein
MGTVSATLVTGTAAERRRAAGAALVEAHPRWHGIRHPELLLLPLRRFSRLDMLPAVERGPARDGRTRPEQARAIVAAHPRWRGIRHPERLVFAPVPDWETALLAYRAALRVALVHLNESESMCRQIDAVADRIDRRSWPWSAAPSRLPSTLADRRPRRRPKLPSLPRLSEPKQRGRRLRPGARLLVH